MLHRWTQVWQNTINNGVSEVRAFVERHVFYITDFFDALSFLVQITFLVVLAVAVIGIIMSHFFGIYKNRKIWERHPKTDLMLSYFCGSGSLQRAMSYKEAHRLLRDGEWSWSSFAGLAYRLGNFSCGSAVLGFVCSLLYIPMGILGLAEMILRVIIGTVWLLVADLVHSLLLLVLRCVSYILIPIWAAADKVARIDQHCPHCYATFNLPAFKCLHCAKVHKQLIPSRCGILIARCQCGHFIPSTLYTGRSRMSAACPTCGGNLVAANAKQFSIQLVGGNFSGKTAFLAAFQHLYLEKTVGIKNLTVTGEPPNYFDELENIYLSGRTQPSSATSELAYSFLHKHKKSAKHNMVVYDIPDEVILSGIYKRNPRNLGFSDAIIFLIDPLSIPAVREECLKAGNMHEVGKYSTDDIGDLIIEFVQQLSSITGRTARRQVDIPVAVVITKSDIRAVKREIGLPKIKIMYRANPPNYGNDIATARNDICRTYLSKLGLVNALNNLDGTFSNVQYFPVSSLGHVSESGKPFQPVGVLAPFLWITQTAKSDLYPIIKNACDFMRVDEGGDDSTSDAKADLLNERYQQAEILFASNQLDAALNIFAALRGYKESAKRANDIQTLRYQQAEKFLSEQDHKKAIDIFKDLGDFKDAVLRTLDARYQQAEQMISDGDYVGAFAIFSDLGSYKDAPKRACSLLPGLIKQGQKDCLSFGSYKWRVLTVTRNKALLVTESIVEKRPYGDNHADVTWENCALREYLNGEFFNSFGAKEKAMIAPTSVSNSNNAQYGTPGGNSTVDKIFLLSIDEVEQYFTDDRDRVVHRYANTGGSDWWWLRSPGGRGVYAAIVDGKGKISAGGSTVDNALGGIRPALWLNL